MMHRCSMDACTCGLYHTQTNSLSMLFSSMSSNAYRTYDEGEMYTPSSGSVDCTLSLGTPSTRRSTSESEKKRGSGFGWNILPSKHTPPPSVAKNHRSGNGGGGDPLLARRCTSCDTTSTPLWRNGPRGPKSLCNACGIRFKKEERRATAAAATLTGGSTHGNVEGSWIAPQKMPCYSSAYGNEFRFIEDEDQYRDSVMSWRFNVTDRASLVHH